MYFLFTFIKHGDSCARSESEGTIQKTGDCIQSFGHCGLTIAFCCNTNVICMLCRHTPEECMKLCAKTPTPKEVSMMSIYPRRMFNIVL
ncbi:hypothetical protein Hanom_Chr00s136664g01817451 [Helianthus anomalus]